MCDRRCRSFASSTTGVNGDLAWNGLERLDRVIADKPDFVSILIGTNDVNATMSERNLLRYRAFNHLPTEPTLTWYECNSGRSSSGLKHETPARLALAFAGGDW